jgi:hypothetical protein
MIFVWKEYWLGVKIDADGTLHAVRIDMATITFANRHIANRSGDRAVLMDRQDALIGAIDDARMNLAKLESMLA